MALRNFNNVTSVGTLSAPLASSATSVTVTGFTGVPTVPFTVTLDRNTPTEEICLVTAVAGSTLTVTRGFDGTAAIAHSAGATIEHTAGAIEYQEANAHTNATANVHGSTGNVVGDQGAQSIFDKTLVSPVLQGDVTAGDAAVAYDPTGSRNLFRGVDSGGTDVVTIDHAGSISTTANLSVGGTTSTGGLLTANGGITVPAGKTLTASGGVVASSVTNNGNGTVAGTLGVTGATTLTGAAALNGGATVPTGKKLTLTDAPGVATDAANKSYVDGLWTSPPTSRAVPKSFGSVTSYPTGVIVGDTCYRSDLLAQFHYNGTGWDQVSVPSLASNSARNTQYATPANIPEGFRIWHSGLKVEQRWDSTGTAWRFMLTGTFTGSCDASGYYAIAHGGGQAPTAWAPIVSAQSTDALSLVVKHLAWSYDSTNLTVRTVRTDSSTYLGPNPVNGYWWAKF